MSAHPNNKSDREMVLETALMDALCWLWAHSSMPEAERLAERLAREANVATGPCRGCGGC